MSGTDDLDVSFRDDDFDLDEQKRSRATSQHSNNPPPTQSQTQTQTEPVSQPTSPTLLSNPRGSLTQPPVPPSHARRLSLLALKPKNSLGDLSALGMSNPADYLRLFRTVLNLQKKCRAWRIKIKQRLKEKVEAEKLRQEQELQQKIQQRKKHKESELHQQRLSISHLTPGKNTPQASARSSTSSSTPAAAFKVALPDRPEELLQFTLCMMRIQRKFRKKLQRARAVLVERLKKQKEAQEREMQEKIMRGKKRKDSGAVTGTIHATPKTQVNRLDLDTVTRTRAISAPPIQEEKEQMSTTQSSSLHVDGSNDALRGSLTNRLRKERKQRRDERLVKLLAEAQQQQQQPAPSSTASQQRVTATPSNTEHNMATVSASRSTTAAAVDREIQVSDDELNESLRVAQLDAASLFIPITSTLNAQRPTSSAHTHSLNSTTASSLSSSAPPLSTYNNSSLPYIPDTRLRDQHLQIQALLASMPKQTKKTTTTNTTTTQPQTAESSSETKAASVTASSAAQPIYLTCPLLCPPQYLTAPLYKRVFGPKRNRSHWTQAEEATDLLIADDGDDWEELIHLPLFTSPSTNNTATSS